MREANQIKKVENLECFTGLKELYLAENKIEKVENLGHLSSLHTLDLSFNGLTKLENLSSLSTLEELWVSSNKLESFESFEHIGELPGLKCVYLELNEVARNPSYRQKVMELVPDIEQIDNFRRNFNIVFKGAGELKKNKGLGLLQTQAQSTS